MYVTRQQINLFQRILYRRLTKENEYSFPQETRDPNTDTDPKLVQEGRSFWGPVTDYTTIFAYSIHFTCKYHLPEIFFIAGAPTDIHNQELNINVAETQEAVRVLSSQCASLSKALQDASEHQMCSFESDLEKQAPSSPVKKDQGKPAPTTGTTTSTFSRSASTSPKQSSNQLQLGT